MNINQLLLGLNFLAVFLTLIFCICLKTLIPAEYKSYIDGILLIAVAILSAGPFVINYLLLRKTPLLPKQKVTYIGLFLLVLMVLVHSACLFVMYSDQFETSRGFGLIACGGAYLIIFLPLWSIFLTYILKKKSFKLF